MIVNVAEVTAADQPDIDSEPGNDNDTEDDQDEVNVGGVEIDLELTKTVSDSVVNVGDNVTWTITVQNQGPSTATGVVVGDALPAGLTVVSATPQVGTIAGTTWTVGTIPVGAAYDLEVVTSVDGTGPYVNVAQVMEADQTDIDSEPGNDDGDQSEDDEDNAEVRAELVDIELTKVVDVESVNVGDNVIFTLVATNLGPSDATGVEIFDQLPGELLYINAIATNGYYNAGTFTWVIGDLQVNGTETLTIEAQVIAPGDILNIAQVSATDQPDIDSTPGNDDGDQSEDDEDNAPLTGEQIDLELQKTVDVTEVNVGDEFTYTITNVN